MPGIIAEDWKEFIQFRELILFAFQKKKEILKGFALT